MRLILSRHLNPVNMVPWFVPVFMIACHLGRPPVDSQGYVIQSVQNSSVESGLQDALETHLTSELATRGALGDGTEVDVRVLMSNTEVVGVEGQSRALLATLVVEVQVGGARPRRTKLTRSLGFTVDQYELSEGRFQRQQAFQALAKEMSGDAVEWILYAP